MDVENFERIAAKRKTCLSTNYFFLFFFGVMLFPINELKYIPLLLGIPLTYFLIGFLFAGLYDGGSQVVFLTTFIVNGLGLCARILLEWGEHTLMNDLTSLNLGLYLIIIPICVVVVYLIVEKVKKRVYEESARQTS